MCVQLTLANTFLMIMQQIVQNMNKIICLYKFTLLVNMSACFCYRAVPIWQNYIKTILLLNNENCILIPQQQVQIIELLDIWCDIHKYRIQEIAPHIHGNEVKARLFRHNNCHVRILLGQFLWRHHFRHSANNASTYMWAYLI